MMNEQRNKQRLLVILMAIVFVWAGLTWRQRTTRIVPIDANFDLGNGAPDLTGVQGVPYYLAFSPDGKYISGCIPESAIPSDTGPNYPPVTAVWRLSDRKMLFREDTPTFLSPVFSPNSRYLAIMLSLGGSENYTVTRTPPVIPPCRIKIWDVNATAIVKNLPNSWNQASSFLDNETLLTEWQSPQILRWRDGKTLRTFSAPKKLWLYSSCLSPDKKLAAFVFSYQEKFSRVQIWDVKTARGLRNLPVAGAQVVMFSADGSQLVLHEGIYTTGEDKPDEGLSVWDWRRSREVQFIAMSRAAKWAVSSQGKILVKAMERWSKIDNEYRDIGGTLEAFDVATGQRLWRQSGPHNINSLQYVCKDRFLLAQGNNIDARRHYATLWDAKSGKLLLALPSSLGTQISPDGRLLAIPVRGAIKLMDVSDLTQKQR